MKANRTKRSARRRRELHVVHFRLGRDAYATLKELCEVRLVTMRSVVSEAVDQWLTRQVEAIEPPVSGRALALRAHADRALDETRRQKFGMPHS